MNWTLTSFNKQDWGDYSVTAHQGEPGVFFIAWHKKQELGTFATGEEAKSACVKHREAAK